MQFRTFALRFLKGLLVLGALFLVGEIFNNTVSTGDVMAQTKSAYDFSFETLVGNKPLPVSEFRGKVILLVNTASYCGFTKQYEGLEKLYSELKDQGFVVLGVPSNDFGAQEPGTPEEIAHFCKRTYDVQFPMTSKQVVSGPSANPMYLWAKEVLGEDSVPKWNFHKILFDRQGKPISYFSSKVTPESEELRGKIKSALEAKP